MEIGDLFFWLKPFEIIFWKTFWWAFALLIVLLIPVVRVWWWVLAPIILIVPLTKFYLWWVRWDHWYPEQKWAILEVKPPREVLTPFKAMEDVFAAIWAIYDAANWREIWCEGELPLSPCWASFEIVSKEGEIHFYIRCQQGHQHLIESAIYSHYPEAEITEAPDYINELPKNIPNEEWNMYGSDFRFAKDDIYPIKTYPTFFEEKAEVKEEKRIDPIVSLIEDMARLGPGEYFWFQMIAAPMTDRDVPFEERAQAVIDKLCKRSGKKRRKMLIEELWDTLSDLIHEKWEEWTEATETWGSISPAASETGEREMLLTPGEREVVSAIENKIKKSVYKTSIRGIYFARRSAFHSEHRKVAESYFPHFAAQNLNFMMFVPETRTKVHYVCRGRRVYLRERKMLRRYIDRFPASFPDMTGLGNMIMSAEELATIYHFPTRLSAVIAPTVTRVEAKKGGPPAGLPTE